MTAANLTRTATAERAAGIQLQRIHLELDLSAAQDPAVAGFPSRTTLEFRAETPETWIDFLGASVDRVVVNGREQRVEWDGARILLHGLRGSNVVTVEATALYSTTGEGLHRFVDPADGETYLYTQYEPADARRVMACFEQPDLKAPFLLDVTAPAGWLVLSNGAVADVAVDGAVQRVGFTETLPISSYITAVAAGPYHRVEDEWVRGEQRVPLAALCRASLAPYLDAEDILTVTKQGLDFYDEHFEYPYPFGRYQQIFVPEYNLGAMENPGLVTFTEQYLFRGAVTPDQRSRRATTIMHEMAHMWFGDLVTMQWWDDLWLKESFADYMGTHALVATRYQDGWVAFANRRKAWAYRQDQLPTTHPIVADIPDLEAAKLNFDGITYAKGAAVLKQLVAFVGEDAFFEGAQRYFRAHAFGNTTLVDLLRHLERASGRSLSDWSDAWLRTSGVTTLRLDREAGVIEQDVPRPHRLRVGVFRLEGGVLQRTTSVRVELRDAGTTVELPEGDLLLLNDGDLSYAKVRLDARSLAAVELALSTIEEPLVRAIVWSALWNATRDGELPAARFLAIVRKHAVAERNPELLAIAIANAGMAARRYLPVEQREREAEELLAAVRAALLAAPAGSDAQIALARAFAEVAVLSPASQQWVLDLLDDVVPPPAGLDLDVELRWQLVLGLAANGAADAARIDAERQRDPGSNGAVAARRALAAMPTAAAKAAAWQSAWDGSLTNELLDAVITGFTTGGDALREPYADEYFARIRSAWSDRTIEIARRLVVGCFPKGDTTAAVDAWLAANGDAPGALVRLVLEQRDELARTIRVLASQPEA